MLRTQKLQEERKIHFVILRNCWHLNQNERNNDKIQMYICTKNGVTEK